MLHQTDQLKELEAASHGKALEESCRDNQDLQVWLGQALQQALDPNSNCNSVCRGGLRGGSRTAAQPHESQVLVTKEPKCIHRRADGQKEVTNAHTAEDEGISQSKSRSLSATLEQVGEKHP